MFRTFDQNKKFRQNQFVQNACMLYVCESEAVHARTHERAWEHPWEREGVHTREGGGERDDCNDFFSFSNKLSDEKRNHCKFIFAEFVLFSKGKKNALAKNIHSYREFELSTSGIFFKKTLCISFYGPVAWDVNTETGYHRTLISLGLLMWIKRSATGPKGTYVFCHTALALMYCMVSHQTFLSRRHEKALHQFAAFVITAIFHILLCIR